MKRRIKLFSYPYILFMFAFICLPLLLLAVYAFTNRATGTISLVNFKNFFHSDYLGILFKSLQIAFVCTLICLILGYPVAYIISKLPKRKQRTLLLLTILPMWMNFLLRTYSWMNILGKNGIINSFLNVLGLESVNLLYTDFAVMLGMVYNFLPFMIYPIYTVLIKIKKEYIEAATDLGADKWVSFKKITLPLSVPGIITGISMVFMPAVSTFVIPSLLGGGKNMLMGNLIEHQFLQKGDWYFGSAVSLVMMVVILFVMYLANKADTTDSSKENMIW